ncbi:MAG: hypothetical protein ACI9FG_000197 [Crocinitomicaceae bacterium]|jgi:hypothetical protein
MEPSTPPETPSQAHQSPQNLQGAIAQTSPANPQTPPKPITLVEEPLTFSTLLNALLKRPIDLISTIHAKQTLPWLPLLLLSIICLSIFGLVIGAFSGAEQLWLAPTKIVLGLSFGALICLPSLYIFSCLSGIDVKFQTVFGLLLCAISLLSLLLVGFAPVVWLFSTSSGSILFFGFLGTALWLICLGFGFKLIGKASKHLGMTSSFHLKVWMAVFTLVTLQLPTTLRPIIGKSDTILNFSEKKFFLNHWVQQIEAPTSKSKVSNDDSRRDR